MKSLRLGVFIIALLGATSFATTTSGDSQMELSGPAHIDPLLAIGAGLLFGSMILGIAVAIIHVATHETTGFKYGTFYNAFALVGSVGMCLAYICFFFLYLGGGIAIFLTILTSAVLVGLLLFALRMKKDSRILFAVLSFYALFSVYLSPLFLWNMIYLFLVAKKPTGPPPVPASVADPK
jgi:hypothetical protein